MKTKKFFSASLAALMAFGSTAALVSAAEPGDDYGTSWTEPGASDGACTPNVSVPDGCEAGYVWNVGYADGWTTSNGAGSPDLFNGHSFDEVETFYITATDVDEWGVGYDHTDLGWYQSDCSVGHWYRNGTIAIDTAKVNYTKDKFCFKICVNSSGDNGKISVFYKLKGADGKEDINVTLHTATIEGSNLNNELFGDTGYTWSDVKLAKFSSDDKFSVQYSAIPSAATDNNSWIILGDGDESSKFNTIHTLDATDFANFDSFKTGGGYVKIQTEEDNKPVNERTQIDINVRLYLKPDAEPDTSAATSDTSDTTPDTSDTSTPSNPIDIDPIDISEDITPGEEQTVTTEKGEKVVIKTDADDKNLEGAKINISNTSLPEKVKELVEAVLKGDTEKAKATVDEIISLVSSGNAFMLDISFTKDGKTVQPGKNVSVTIPVPAALKKANALFVYHVSDKGAETVNSEFDKKNGTLTLTNDKFSPYVISQKKLANVSEQAGDTDSSPDTNNTNTSTETPNNGNPNTGIALAIAPVIFAGAAVVVLKKRK